MLVSWQILDGKEADVRAAWPDRSIPAVPTSWAHYNEGFQLKDPPPGGCVRKRLASFVAIRLKPREGDSNSLRFAILVFPQEPYPRSF